MDNNELKKKNLEAGFDNFLESFNIDDDSPDKTSDVLSVDVSEDKNTQNSDEKVVTNISKNPDEKTTDNTKDMPSNSNDSGRKDIADTTLQSPKEEPNPVFSDDKAEVNSGIVGSEIGFFENFNEVFGDVNDNDESIETSQVVGEPLFSTFEVADELGITPQTIRNYIGYFKDFLNVERDERGHTHFTTQDVETLKLILDLRRDKKLSKEKIREYLLNNGNITPIVGSQPKSQSNNSALSKEMLSSFAEYLNKLFMDSLGGFKGDINDNFTSVKDLLGSMKETIKSQEELVKEQGNVIQNQKDEIKRLNDVIVSLKNITKDSKASIETIKSTTKSTQELIDTSKKEMIDAIASNSGNDVDTLAKALASEYKASTSKINDKLNENKQAISNISKSVEVLSKNSGNNNTYNENQLQEAINSSIEQKYSELYKNIQKDNTELVNKLSELINAPASSVPDENLRTVVEDMKTKFEKAEKTIRVLADKNTELNSKYEEAIKDNQNLKRKLQLTTELVKRLSPQN